jgi:hypothetical protein
MGIASGNKGAITNCAGKKAIERVVTGVVAGELPPREPPGTNQGPARVGPLVAVGKISRAVACP